MQTVKLYRPVGLKELELILEEHFAKYAIQNVGGSIHNELWIPSQELDMFNKNIVGEIRVIGAFFGDEFRMPEDLVLVEVLQKFKSENNLYKR
jgi:hypothetical protein